MPTRLSVLVCTLAVAAVAAQEPQAPPQATFRAGANYVRVDMYATADGEPVQDLRADEVTILEDGVPQRIEAFEHVLVRPAGGNDFTPEVDGLRASREAAADPRARVFVIFLDSYHTQLEGSANVRQPLVRFLDRVLGPDDLVALMTPEMGASDLTLGRKTTVISRILEEEWWGRRARVADQDPKERLYEACGYSMGLGGNEAEALFRKMRARRREKLTLDALDDLVTHLNGLRDERKAVVVVTEGWLLFEPDQSLHAGTRPAIPPLGQSPVLPPSERGDLGAGVVDRAMEAECEADRIVLSLIDHPRRLREITEEANRSNVTFYPVYAQGLTAFDAPIGPDRPPPPIVDSNNLRNRQTNMRALAWDTDGEAIINTNDIAGGLKRIADDLSSYYLLGYYSTNTALDGRFREITVRVNRPGVRVRARRGYRGRTPEDLVSTAAGDDDPGGEPLRAALNTVAGLNTRAPFRIRSASWLPEGASEGAFWIVGELDYATRRELAWSAGASAEVSIVPAGGGATMTRTVEVTPVGGSFALRVPESGRVAPGEYAVRVRVEPEGDPDQALSDIARVTLVGEPSALGEAVLWRRGPSTGPRYALTADPRFQRNERLRLELPAAAAGPATARVLDRAGETLQVPAAVSDRQDASGTTWIVVDANLAPLAPGDYAVEVEMNGETRLTGFRVVP